MLYLKPLIEIVLILSSLGVIGLVLLQHGKGADMGASFGSGASGSLFGASGSANFLSHLTAILATIFFASTLALTWLGSYHARPSAGVLGEAMPPARATAASAPAGASVPVGASGAVAVPVMSAASSVQPASVPAPSHGVPR